MNAFAPLNGFLFVLFLVILAIDVWALIDAAFRPAPSYVAAEKKTKTFWLVILAAATACAPLGFLMWVGLIASIVYFVDVRPAVREVSGGRGSSGGPYGGW